VVGEIAAVLAGSQRWHVAHGDCREILRTLPDCSVDACVTDPPYEIGFMGRKWDRTGIAYDVAMWREVLRVLKPGAHLLCFGGTRTWHRIACAIEDAGFQVRDSIAWLFASGFPKSLNVSVGIDTLLGKAQEREIVGPRIDIKHGVPMSPKQSRRGSAGVTDGWNRPCETDLEYNHNNTHITRGATPESQQWDGWGTATKPAFEPITMARKPLAGTIAANVLKHGTGGLNIDGCRIEMSAEDFAELQAGVDAIRARGGTMENSWKNSSDLSGANPANPLGRWPANVCLDEHMAAELDKQSGDRPGMSGGGKHADDYAGGMFGSIDCEHTARNDNGGASRFFFCAKASRSERDAGLDDFDPSTAAEATDSKDGQPRLDCPRTGAGRTGGARNTHPTVKPLALLQWLCRLVTPPGGIVIDPFTGSGSGGVAASLEGFRFIGMDLEALYVDFSRARISHAVGGSWQRITPRPEGQRPPIQPDLFAAQRADGGKR
jgi:hypothetical protein